MCIWPLLAEDLHASIRLAALKDLATTLHLMGYSLPLPVYDSGREEGRNDEDEIYGAVLGDTLDVTIHI